MICVKLVIFGFDAQSDAHFSPVSSVEFNNSHESSIII